MIGSLAVEDLDIFPRYYILERKGYRVPLEYSIPWRKRDAPVLEMVVGS